MIQLEAKGTLCAGRNLELLLKFLSRKLLVLMKRIIPIQIYTTP